MLANFGSNALSPVLGLCIRGSLIQILILGLTLELTAYESLYVRYVGL